MSDPSGKHWKLNFSLGLLPLPQFSGFSAARAYFCGLRFWLACKQAREKNEGGKILLNVFHIICQKRIIIANGGKDRMLQNLETGFKSLGNAGQPVTRGFTYSVAKKRSV